MNDQHNDLNSPFSHEYLVEKFKEAPDLYFSPSIEDIHVGYECEVKGRTTSDSLEDLKKVPFYPHTVVQSDEIPYLEGCLLLGTLRTPYLTSDQIEKEGWVFSGKAVDIWYEKEGIFQIGSWTSYKLRMHYGKDHRLYIHAVDQGEEHHLFEGTCKDINTFRKICKLLNI